LETQKTTDICVVLPIGGIAPWSFWGYAAYVLIRLVVLVQYRD